MIEHLDIKEKGRKPEEQEIVNFEKEIGTRLPMAYRKFLLSVNAKYIAESSYEIKGEIYEIHGFITFGCGEWALEQHYRNLKEHFENRYLGFAYDSGGWRYIMSIEQNDDYGKIYFCRMDEEIEKGTTLIANSFGEFIRSLCLA